MGSWCEEFCALQSLVWSKKHQLSKIPFYQLPFYFFCTSLCAMVFVILHLHLGKGAVTVCMGLVMLHNYTA